FHRQELRRASWRPGRHRDRRGPRHHGRLPVPARAGRFSRGRGVSFMSGGPVRVHLADEAATARLGEDIAAILAPGDAILLSGDLGMGKTTLARALIRALAGDDGLDVPSPTFTMVQPYAGRVPVHHFDLYRLASADELAELGLGEPPLAAPLLRRLAGADGLDVPSPTFTMVQPYAGRVPVHHFDLYRLASADELEELGLREALEEGVALVEWPERAAGALPADAVRLTLSEAGDGRDAEIDGPAAFLARLSRSLAIRAFLDASGRDKAARRFLTGDASARAYETATTPGQPPV